jgi:hypothetical protein
MKSMNETIYIEKIAAPKNCLWGQQANLVQVRFFLLTLKNWIGNWKLQ